MKNKKDHPAPTKNEFDWGEIEKELGDCGVVSELRKYRALEGQAKLDEQSLDIASDNFMKIVEEKNDLQYRLKQAEDKLAKVKQWAKTRMFTNPKYTGGLDKELNQILHPTEK